MTPSGFAEKYTVSDLLDFRVDYLGHTGFKGTKDDLIIDLQREAALDLDGLDRLLGQARQIDSQYTSSQLTRLMVRNGVPVNPKALKRENIWALMRKGLLGQTPQKEANEREEEVREMLAHDTGMRRVEEAIKTSPEPLELEPREPIFKEAFTLNDAQVELSGNIIVRRYNIIGTDVWDYEALELDVSDPYSSVDYKPIKHGGAPFSHSTIGVIDHRWYGRVGTRRLPSELERLPAYSAERLQAVGKWHEDQNQEAYRLIESAFPEAKKGDHSMGKISLALSNQGRWG